MIDEWAPDVHLNMTIMMMVSGTNPSFCKSAPVPAAAVQGAPPLRSAYREALRGALLHQLPPLARRVLLRDAARHQRDHSQVDVQQRGRARATHASGVAATCATRRHLRRTDTACAVMLR